MKTLLLIKLLFTYANKPYPRKKLVPNKYRDLPQDESAFHNCNRGVKITVSQTGAPRVIKKCRKIEERDQTPGVKTKSLIPN